MATGSTRQGTTNLIGGEWEPSRRSIEVEDLADGGVFARRPAATAEQARAAVAAAAGAERAMRETTLVQRANWLTAIADGLGGRAVPPGRRGGARQPG
jgi:glyceraldehyde-3-phosphate dehydrogenase [NAD(P)+]